MILITLLIILFILVVFFLSAQRFRKTNEKSREETKELQCEFVFEKYIYNGRLYTLPMRTIEKEIYWDVMSRGDKRLHVKKMIEAIKTGRVVQVDDLLIASSDKSKAAQIAKEAEEFYSVPR